MQSANPHQQLLEAIAQLSDQQLPIVLRFIQTLQANPIATPTHPPIDPIANLIGASTHGNLAHEIDETLYD